MLLMLPLVGVVLIFLLVVFVRGGMLGKSIVVSSAAFILHPVCAGLFQTVSTTTTGNNLRELNLYAGYFWC